MTDKPDTSAAALRNKAIEHDNFGYNVTANLLRAIADEKESWTAREAELVRERDEARADAKTARNTATINLSEWKRQKARAEKAEAERDMVRAEAAAMRSALKLVVDRKTANFTIIEWNQIKDALSSTAGRDLLARVERMRHALVLLLDEADCFDNRPLEPHCQECTKGQTPAEFDQGLCAYHIAKAALADKEPPA